MLFPDVSKGQTRSFGDVGPMSGLPESNTAERCMSTRPKAIKIAFLVAAATTLVDPTDSALAQAPPCRSREYAHNVYTICEVDLAKQTVRLYWKRSDGTPYSYLSSLPRALEHETGRLLFATNAGMFDPALKPVGLYVEQGRELRLQRQVAACFGQSD